jgi:TatA/E family protein of Tat protein translocase
MGNIGMPEILLIMVIALIIFGPRKLPELGRSLGQSLAQFRRASEDFKRQWEDEVDLERHRLDAPPPPVERAGNISSGAEVDSSPELNEDLWNQQASDQAVEETKEPEASETAPVTMPAEQTIPRETKRDWM